jgi:hypothetical protein
MKIVERTPSKWYTASGPMKPADLDQQHLSNIYWYFYIVLNVKMQWASRLTEKNFGKLLPYQPNTAFKAEIAILREKGLITENRESVKDTILKKHIELEEAF